MSIFRRNKKFSNMKYKEAGKTKSFNEAWEKKKEPKLILDLDFKDEKKTPKVMPDISFETKKENLMFDVPENINYNIFVIYYDDNFDGKEMEKFIKEKAPDEAVKIFIAGNGVQEISENFLNGKIIIYGDRVNTFLNRKFETKKSNQFDFSLIMDEIKEDLEEISKNSGEIKGINDHKKYAAQKISLTFYGNPNTSILYKKDDAEVSKLIETVDQVNKMTDNVTAYMTSDDSVGFSALGIRNLYLVNRNEIEGVK